MRNLSPLILGMLIAVAPVQPVLAAEKADKDKSTAQTVALEAVALPVIVDGRLLNYVFCSIRLDLAPNADGAKVRAKEQFIRDDLVRTGHRTPFTRSDDYTRVDEAKVRAEVLRFAPSVVGPGVVKSVVITKQTSQKLMTLPPASKTPSHEILP